MAKIKYHWNEGWEVKGLSADVAGRIVAESMGYENLPAKLAQDARSRKHPFHKCLEWDDGKAAEQYRISQVRLIIRSLRTRIKTTDGEKAAIRAFSNIFHGSGMYYFTPDVLKDKELRKKLLEQAKRDAKKFANKYRGLVGIGSIVKAMKGFLEEVAE